MNRFIVTTTINPPTEALRKFAAMSDWKLVIVGDRKTPHDAYADWKCSVYLSPEKQEQIDLELSDLIGWNCIQRRNMGFVYAMQHGADVIATVDDDNVPLEQWGERVFAGQEVLVSWYESDQPAFDPLHHLHKQIWHRGFPLQWVAGRSSSNGTVRTIKADVQAGLWHGDPDIDAVCRMLNPKPIDWGFDFPPFAANKPSPFNSQNTILSRAAMKHFFCFPGIGRMDDIYGSYVVQAHGFKVAYESPTVHQQRNEHDVTNDFEAEIGGYTKCAKLITALNQDPEAWRKFVPERAAKAFVRYRELVA